MNTLTIKQMGNIYIFFKYLEALTSIKEMLIYISTSLKKRNDVQLHQTVGSMLQIALSTQYTTHCYYFF